MTPAEAAVNIRIAVRSADAFAAVGRITVALEALETAALSAGKALGGIDGVVTSTAAAMNKAAADGAALAKALSSIHGSKAATTLSNINGAATTAASSMAAAATAATNLATALLSVVTAADAAAASMAGFGAAARGAGAAAGAAAGGAGAASAASGFASAGAAAAGAVGSMKALESGGRRLERTWYDLSDPIRATAEDMRYAGRASAEGLTAITDGTDRARANSRAYSTEARTLNNSLATQNAELRNSYAGWDAFNNRLGTASQSIRRAGSQAQWTGRQLSFMFTAPVVAAGAFGFKWAMDIETSMTRLRKVYDGAAEDVDKLGRYFRALSEVMGIQQSEVAEIGASWAAVGATGSELAKMVKLTTEAMVLGQMDSAEATEALIAIQAQYRLNSHDLMITLAQLNSIENATGASMQDLVGAYQRSAATARQAGVDQAHLGAMIATLVPASGSAAKAGIALNSVIAQVMSPTNKAARALESLGFNIDDTAWRTKTFTERIEDIADQFGRLDQQSKMDLARPLAGIFQMPKAVQMLTDIYERNGKGLSYYRQALEGATDQTKAMAIYQKELNIALASNPQKVKQAGVIIQNALVDAIIPLIPHIVWLIQSIAKLFKAFADMSPVTQKWIIVTLLLLAAIGPLAMLFGSIAILAGVMGRSFYWASRATAAFAFHILGLGRRMVEVDGVMQARSPLIVRTWRAMHTAMAAISTAFMVGLRAIYAAGLLIVQGLLAAGGALGLRTFTWYQTLQTRVQAAASAARVNIVRGEQAAATATVAAGGRAQTAAAAAGAAGAAGATRRGWGRGGVLGILIGILAFFPNLIWNALKAVVSQVGAVGRQIGMLFMAGFRGIPAQVTGVGARILAAVFGWLGRMTASVVGAFTGMGPAILRGVGTWLPRLGGVLARAVGLFTGPIGWIVTGIITLIAMFPRQAMAAARKLAEVLAWPFLTLGRVAVQGFRALLGVIARAGSAIANIVRGVWSDGGVPILAKPFVIGVKIAAAALTALPRVVVAVFRAVVRAITSAAQSIYRAFSYLNPFARHSPSLVDNVRAGMQVVTSEFADASRSIQNSLRSAYGAMNSFGNATAGIRMSNQSRVQGEERAKIATLGPGATAEYDNLRMEMARLESQADQTSAAIRRQEQVVGDLQRAVDAADKQIEQMNRTLDDLQAAADAVGKQLDEANEKLDYYKNAPIQGTQAMSDAIFENEMAQKRLRLEIMKMEDAGQSVDNVADKFAKLQGEIETLSGKREELRRAGAGSDVLGTYDSMIADLQRQQGALGQGGNSEIEKAQKQLEELERRGERLNLEQSIKFDPLNREAEKLANNVREMPFEEKIAGIKRYQGEVDRLTVAHDAANKAVEAQQAAIDGATRARDDLSGALDVEQEKLDALNDTHDKLTQAMDDGQQSIDATVSAMDDMQQAQEEAARAAEEAAKAAEDQGVNLDDMGAKADDAASKVDDLAKATKGAEDALMDFGMAGEGLGDFDLPGGSFESDGMMEDIDKLTQELTDKVAGMFGEIDLFAPIKKKWNDFKTWLSELPGRIVSTIAGWASSAGSWFASVGSAIGQWFSELPGKISTIVSGWASSAGTWFSGVGTAIGEWFANLGSSVGSFFSNLWSGTIWPALQALPGQLADFFRNLPTNLVEAFAYLVGFIAGMFAKAIAASVVALHTAATGIWDFFTAMPSRILGFLQGLGNLLGDLFWRAIEWSVQTLHSAAVGIHNFFSELPSRIVGALQNLGTWLGDVFARAIEWSVTTIHNTGVAIHNWFSELPARLLGYLLDFGNMLGDLFMRAIQSVSGNADNWAEGLYQWFIQLPAKVILFLRDFPGMMAEKGAEVIAGLLRGIINASNGIADWVKVHVVDPFVNGFKDALGIASPSRVMMDIGTNVVQGMIDGIGSMGSALWDFVKNFIKRNVVDRVKDTLGISSPSTVMTQFGQDTGQGLVNGLESKGPEVTAAMQGLSDRITSMPLPPVDSSQVMDDFSAAAGNAKNQVDVLSQGLSAYIGQATSTQNSQIALNDALKAGNDQIGAMPGNLGALSGALLTAGGHVDVSTDQGRRLHDTLTGVATQYGEAGNAAIQSALSQGRSHEQALQAAIDAGAGMRGSLVATLEQMGLNSGQAQALADQYLGMVREYWSQLMLNKAFAQSDLDKFKQDNYFMDVQLRLHEDPNAPKPPPGKTTEDYSLVPYGKASGGWISGPGTGTSDSILAAVSNGEYVVNAASAQKHAALLEAINSDKELPKFAAGGLVGAAQAALGGAAGQALSAQAMITVTSPVADLPKQVVDATMAAKTAVDQYMTQSGIQLETIRTSFQTAYENVRANVTAKMQEMGLGQITIQANNNGILLQGQANFNGATLSGAIGLKDGVVSVHGQMASQLGTITVDSSNYITATRQAMSDNVGRITVDSSNFIVSTNQTMADNVNRITQESATYQGQVMTTNRDNWNTLSGNTRDLTTNNFTGMATNLRGVMDGSITPMMNEFGPLMQYVTDSFGNAVTNISTVWDQMREGTAKPVRFTIEQVFNDGIVGMWNSVSDLIGTDKMAPYPVRFATGGPVPLDMGERGKDSVPALLMPGEYVLQRSVAQSLGYSNLDKINNGSQPEGLFGPRFNRKDIPKFAGGGPVPGSPAFEALKKAHDWARSRNGRPYVLGGSAEGAGGTDCSGYMSGIANVIQGGNGARQWATMAFNGGGNSQAQSGPQGFVAGLAAGFSIGVLNGGPAGGHTAGTLGGVPGLPTTNVEAGGSHGNVAYGGPAVGADHSQFPTRYHLPIVNDAFVSGGAGGGSAGPSTRELVDAIRGPAWEKIMTRARSYQQNGSIIEKYPLRMAERMRKSIDATIDKQLETYEASIPAGAGAERWRPQAIEAMRRVQRGLRPDDKAQVDAMISQIHSESGGDPNAVQKIVDVNGTGESAGVGLLQIIPSTWAAHRDPSLPDDRKHPFANMVGALRYYTSTYGPDLTRMWGQGHGYDSGGVLPPGVTKAVNNTGKPEAILTNSQWNNIGKLAQGIGNFVKRIAKGIGDVLRKVFRRPIPTKPVDPPGGGGPGGPGTQNPPPVPPKGYWEDAAQQMASWTPDLVKAMDGFEGVIANAPRILGETVVSEWPDLPAPPPPPPVEPPQINLPPALVNPPSPPPVVPETPGTGTGTPGTGTGGGAGTGTPGTGTGAPGTGAPGSGGAADVAYSGSLQAQLVDLWNRFMLGAGEVIAEVQPAVEAAVAEMKPTLEAAAAIAFSDPAQAMRMVAEALGVQAQKLAPVVEGAIRGADARHGLSPEQQQALVSSAKAAVEQYAAQHGVSLPPEFYAFVDAVQKASTQAQQNTNPQTATTANTRANNATGQSQTVQSSVTITININGDLSMPNVKTKEDAAAFINNLRNLVKT